MASKSPPRPPSSAGNRIRSRLTERVADLTLLTGRRAPRRWLRVLWARAVDLGETHTHGLGRRALMVLVLNLVLVALLESLQMAGTIASGGHYVPRTGVRDVILKLPWALLLCFALWLAIMVGRSRPFVVGLAGLVVAPLASLAAHTLAVGAENLALAAGVSHNPSPLAMAGLRGLEYASLGATLAWLHNRRWAQARHHAYAGLLAGLIFGGGVLALTAATQALTPVLMIAWLVNNLLFPVGCALILFHTGGPRPAEPDTAVTDPGETERAA